MSRWCEVSFVGLFVAATLGCDNDSSSGGEALRCSDVGATFTPDYDCNLCTCGADLTWSCTRSKCGGVDSAARAGAPSTQNDATSAGTAGTRNDATSAGAAGTRNDATSAGAAGTRNDATSAGAPSTRNDATSAGAPSTRNDATSAGVVDV